MVDGGTQICPLILSPPPMPVQCAICNCFVHIDNSEIPLISGISVYIFAIAER